MVWVATRAVAILLVQRDNDLVNEDASQHVCRDVRLPGSKLVQGCDYI
jgi:hypothetical protein